MVVYIIGCGFNDAVNATEYVATESTQPVPEGYTQELLDAYEDFCKYIYLNNILVDVSVEDFYQEYEKGTYNSLNEYVQKCCALFESNRSESSGSTYTISVNNWYYNTGTKLKTVPDYSRYNLLQNVKAGDIIYQAKGESSITGHIALVEGIYYDLFYGSYYIRLVESIGYLSGSGQGDGVCRGVLDDDRYDNREATVLRVTSANSSQLSGAINFCVNQIGKNYSTSFFSMDTSPSETNWYCSELVYAAFMNQGINLETDSTNPGIWPTEIYNSSLTSVVQINSLGTPSNVNVVANSMTSATVSWSAISGASGYYVYSATSATGPYSYLGSTTSRTYTDNSCTSGERYYYRILAYSNGKYGGLSDPEGVLLKFAEPTIIRCYATSSTSAYLNWVDVYNATTYYVYRSVGNNGTYNLIGSTTNPYYTNTGLTPGVSYSYKIQAVNSGGTTSMSAGKLVVPTKVVTPEIYFGGIDPQNNCVAIKWTYSPGATSYDIYIANNIYSPAYSYYTSTTETYFRDTTLMVGTYIFKIVARSGSGSSDYSSAYYVSL